jgi:redox-sensitive bicupin YhaK (pirin superfamily)
MGERGHGLQRNIAAAGRPAGGLVAPPQWRAISRSAMASLSLSRRQLVMAAGAAAPAAAIAASALGRGGEPPANPGLPERAVRLVIDAQPTADGAGVQLRRALGSRALPMLDPFLLLDEMHSDRPQDYEAGFPTHPHRGFETVTYVLEGAVHHKDSLGNEGHLVSGSTQWMTAGRGIVHSEMPGHDATSTRLWGFQLWVNLPAARKMTTPRYQDLMPARIPEVPVGDATVRLVAGEAGGLRGPVEGIVTDPTMLDVKLPARGRFSQPLDPAHNAFLYVIDGAADVGDERTATVRVRAGQVAVLGTGGTVTLRSAGGARGLLFAARPIGEPVARSGPFVMNTDEELRRAWDDYRSGRLVGG